MPYTPSPVSPTDPLPLDDRAASPPRSLESGDELKALFREESARLEELQKLLYASASRALLVVLQGRDASGKDGTVRAVFSACNPMGCQVSSFRAPTPDELAHDFLWRVHQRVPARGMIGIFNRSHYEDVLVVRVRELAPRAVWRARFDQINAFEEHLANNGVVIVKFFLHVSRDEQRKQLLERLTDPTKNWKFRAGDLDDRKQWGDYTKAYREAIRRCSTPWAPWYVIPSDQKTVRNYMVARVLNETLTKLRLTYPRASADVLALAEQLRPSG